jgi:hypothetical protein
MCKTLKPGYIKMMMRYFFGMFLFMPLLCFSQQKDTLVKKTDTIRVKADSIKKDSTQQSTGVHGIITDAVSGKPLAYIGVGFTGSNFGTRSDEHGYYTLTAQGSFRQVKFIFMGYKSLLKPITPGRDQVLNVKLESSQTQLKEVVIKSARKQRYRNKGNPAVELIQQVIDHKSENKMEDADYLQYDQYERIAFSLVDLSPKFLNGKFFAKYRFLLDTSQVADGKKQPALPVYMSEKLSQYFYRKNPEKAITVQHEHKEVDFNSFIDSKGLDTYLNRLYGQVDIYSNNIFILTNQFLSPIADHSPAFYKFFITDTIQSGNQKLIELSFVPRNRGDLLFEGKLLVTMDGHYAVKGADLNIDKHINLNFLRSVHIHLDFEPQAGARYFLVKSDLKADFGLFKDKGAGFAGERTVFFNNYKLNTALPSPFYDGSSSQTAPDTGKIGPAFWAKHRTDTLAGAQAKVYSNIDSLETIPSFKRAMWIAKLVIGSYGDLGPVQLGPFDALYSFNTVEGTRFSVGGRTTPEFNKSIYLEGYTAYGFKDQRVKYYLSSAFSFNQQAPYLFPNNYLKVSYQYDTDIPGQNFLIDKGQSLLESFTRNKSDLWLYNRIFKLNYVRDFQNHFSYNIEFKNWQQQPAGTLVYQATDPLNNHPVSRLTTTEVNLLLRYAPNEKFLEGTVHRFTIPSKYPIFTMGINYGVKGLVNGEYNYLNLSAKIYKRFYLSQLGYTDVTLLGGAVLGQVPFPLLAILPANQTYVYDSNGYNMMNFLEFVSDHYAGLNVTHYFGGFFLNKIPLIESLKLREILSFKILYGGLRDQNNPSIHTNLYKFPTYANGAPATYILGNTPYVEAGAGISNIFKVLRVDVIHRFNYLNQPGVTPWGLRFSFSPDL